MKDYAKQDIEAMNQAIDDLGFADEVNSPSHYTQGPIECIEAMESALTPEEFRGACKANALKYIWREQKKGGNESLKKAIWYLERALSWSD
ncbi:DUF3310 domain-containing protein [Spiribacter onubensis]|uniref:DUF3310 domain-containing protein n=1 Tax=Spiribacter onubensis TaxID=3122420 RepID=A0ABV3S6V2_9GAMM